MVLINDKNAADMPPTKARRSRSKPRTQPVGVHYNPEELRRLILEAATDEFAEHGFSGARIDNISKAAGTVDRMIYYYFDKKDGLYRAVLEHIYEDINREMRTFECELDDPLASIRKLVIHNWEYHTQRPQAVRLLMNENLLRGVHLQKFSKIRHIHHPLISTTERLLEEGKRRKLIRQDAEVETTLLTILSLVFFYVSNQYTCASWLHIKMMTKPRMEGWIEHICKVVTLSLATSN